MLIGKSLGRNGRRRLPKSARRSRPRRRTTSAWQLESLESRILLAADLVILQESDASLVLPDSPVAFTITARNDGPDAVDRVRVMDTFSSQLANVTYRARVSGDVTGYEEQGSDQIDDTLSMAAGSSITYTVAATVAMDAADRLVNTATVSVPTEVGDTDLTNNVATIDLLVSPAIGNADDDAGRGSREVADLSITKTNGVDVVVPGEAVTYTIVVTNEGPANAGRINVVDRVPVDLVDVSYTSDFIGDVIGSTTSGEGSINDLLSMEAGASVSYTITGTLESDSTATSLTNTATVSVPEGDPDESNNSVTDSDRIEPRADLSLTTTNGLSEIEPGQPVGYTILVTNQGPSDAPQTRITDDFATALDGVTWIRDDGGQLVQGSDSIDDLVDLPAGSSLTYVVQASVSPAVGAALSHLAVAAPSNGVVDLNTENNRATDVDPVARAEVDVAIRKESAEAMAVPGRGLTYTLMASNVGLTDVVGARITDDFLDQLSNVTFTSETIGEVTGNTPAGTGDLDETVDLAVGASVVYTIRADLDSAAAGVLQALAEIQLTDQVDTNPGNNFDLDVLPIVAHADLSVTNNNGRQQVAVGEQLSYEIVVSNAGPSDVRQAKIDYVVPQGFEDVTWMPPDATRVDGMISIALDLDAGDSQTFTLTGRVGNQVAGLLVNTVQVAGPSDGSFVEIDSSNNSAADIDSIESTQVLGSEPTVVLSGEIEEPGGADRFRIAAHSTGKMIVNAIFDHDLGDLSLAIDDATGNTIAIAESSDDNEQLVIPVVSQEVYFVRVLAADEESSNSYDLEIENFVVPVPSVLRLTPQTDTGMSDQDAITADPSPTVILQADIADYLAMGIPLLQPIGDESGPLDLPNQAGVAVRVSTTDLTTGDIQSGYASTLGEAGTLFEFAFAEEGLPSGFYVVNAAVEIFDGRSIEGSPEPAAGRGQLSTPFWITIDLDPPDGADRPDLLNASDTGMSLTDDVTSKMQPAFSGVGEPNAKVRIIANRVGTQAEVIGQSVTNADGSWEITVEPVADDKYAFRAEYEDAAGNISSIGEPLLAEIDSVKPNTPFLDLITDTGLSDSDNVTNSSVFMVSMTTTDPRQDEHLIDFNYKYRIFVRPDASDPSGNPTELLIYDSSLDTDIPLANLMDGLTDLEQLSKSLGPLPDGVHNLKLEVEDRAGNISDDFLLTISIDTRAPAATIDLISSSDTGVFDDDDVTSKMQPAFAGVSEVNSKVNVFANGVLVGTGVVGSDQSDGVPDDGMGAWEVTVEPLADGRYEMVAEIEDQAGNLSRSESLSVWIDSGEPNVPFLDLLSDTGIDPLDRITNDSTPNVSITAAATNDGGSNPFPNDIQYRLYDRPGDGIGEVLLVDSYAVLGGLTNLGFFTETLPELDDGQHNLKLEIEDRAGNISHAFLLEVVVDTVPPSLSESSLQSLSDSGMFADDFVTAVTSPALGGIGSIGDTVSASSNGLLLGSTLVGSDESDGIVGNALGAWEIQLDPLNDGEHQIDLQIEDLAGNVIAADPLTLWIDATQPNLPLLDLLTDSGHSDNDGITNDNTPTVSVTANDTPDGGENPFPNDVKFRIYDRDGFNDETLLYDSFSELGGFVEGGLFEVTLPELSDGMHNLKLEVEDRAGNISHEYLLELKVDTESPEISTIDLAEFADSGMSSEDRVTNIQSPAFLGLGTVGDQVLIFANDELVGEAIVHSDESDGVPDDGIGLWEITVEPLDDGNYTIMARIEDWAGNSSVSDEIAVEIDTLEPNTPFLDLLEAFDSGRHDDDNITFADSLVFSATTSDPNSIDHLVLFPEGQNLKYRVYARPESGDEVLVYNSSVDGAIGDLLDGLTAQTQVLTTPIDLPEGLHNLKLEVEDRAGNISHDFLLDLLVDRTGYVGDASLHPDSNTGVNGVPLTFVDRITQDRSPVFAGRAEANALVTVAIGGVPIGTAVAIPLDGDDAVQPPNEPYNLAGNWILSSVVALRDGQYTVDVSYEDPAGNREGSSFDFVVDSEGPKIVNVTKDIEGFPSVFDPKPASGPDPLMDRIVVHFSDGPERESILYEAVVSQLAAEEGNYQLVGDANGNIPIVRVDVDLVTTGPGLAMTQATLVFAEPLPDDRYTFTVSDSISDPAGNALDGESGAASPFGGSPGLTPVNPIFPSGDGVPGGDFVARFTVDSRPEIGVWGAGSIWVDTNGNFEFDPENPDFTNRDIVYRGGFTSDEVFAGNFALEPDDLTDGYDKLAVYGKFDDTFRWLVDTDNDGVPNIDRRDPNNANGLPVAGQFDGDEDNGDEVGVFDGEAWYFDTDHDFKTDTVVSSNLTGYPFVGDFDGDGFDDLATWSDDKFMLDLAGGSLLGWDGYADHIVNFGFIGVRERPVAADMDQDGFDDIGIWVPDRPGVLGRAASEWYFLISGGDSLIDRISPPDDPINSRPTIDFTPQPFGNDLFAQFGDEFALPLVGNFDPPTLLLPDQTEEYTNPQNPLDVNADGNVSPLDALLVINELNNVGAHPLEERIEGTDYLDVNGDMSVTPLDALLVLNEMNRTTDGAAPLAARPDVSLTSALLADELFAERAAIAVVDEDAVLPQAWKAVDSAAHPARRLELIDRVLSDEVLQPASDRNSSSQPRDAALLDSALWDDEFEF